MDSLASPQPVLLLGGALVYGAWVGTQVIAHGAGHHRALGAWAYLAPSALVSRWRALTVALVVLALVLLVVARRRPATVSLALACLLCAGAALVVSLGPVYDPTRGVVWAIRLGRDPRLGPLVARGVYAGGGTFAFLVVMLLAVRRRTAGLPSSTSHGSAAWGHGDALRVPSGLLLGALHRGTERRGHRVLARHRHGDDMLRYAGDGHVLTVAPTRSGKGVGCVIPNLLTHPGPVVVTDPKGENYAVTARWRRTMGQAVYALDPFDTLATIGVAAPGGSAAYNPLDLVDATSDEAVDDARLLAEMLVLPDARGSEVAFWNEEARGLFTGLILHVAASAPPELRTLPYVRELLTLPPELFGVLLEDMLASSAAGGLVSRAAARTLQKAERERSGVISAAQSHTHFLDSPRLARVLGTSTVPLHTLKVANGGPPVALYLVLPPDRLEAYARWLRVMIAASLLCVMRKPGEPAQRVLFLLDEFAHLGRMQPVERAIGLAAGYGATFWLLVQDLAQLKATYPERWPTFLANCDVLQAFGANDWETADHLSKLTGEATIQVASQNRSVGVSRGQHAQRQEGAALTLAERGRRLLTPDEVLRLPPDRELLFVKAQAPVLARRVDYRTDATLLARASANPMHAPSWSSDRVAVTQGT